MFKKTGKGIAVFSAIALLSALMLSGCQSTASKNTPNSDISSSDTDSAGKADSTAESSFSPAPSDDTPSTASGTAVSSLDTDSMFTDRDLAGTYEETDAQTITLADGASKASSDTVTIRKDTITITGEGTYILTGNLSNGQIVVDAPKDAKIQLVLNNVSISNKSTACIYPLQADKVFITSAKDSQNKLSVTGEYQAIDDNKIDAAIFAKSDIVLNGQGALTIDTDYGHGIVSKDDLKISGGTYEITAGRHGLSGKDSVRIADGTIQINSKKDGIHSENEDDISKGYTYIRGGSLTINSEDDGIHSATLLQIDNGNIKIEKSTEGFEGQTILVNEGDIDITSSDDGFNASSKNTSSDNNQLSGNFSKQANAVSMSADPAENNTDGGNSYKNGTGYNGRENRKGFNGPGGRGGGGFGGDSDESCSLTINGGTIHVNAEGDGLDSNGLLLVNGGTIYVAGPTRQGNGALDSGTEATITGGTVIAADSGGMAENFGTASTQGSILVNLSGTKNGKISLTASDGTVLAGWTPEKSYNNVVVSTPGIQTGKTYTLSAGGQDTTVKMDSLIYGEGSQMGKGRRGI